MPVPMPGGKFVDFWHTRPAFLPISGPHVVLTPSQYSRPSQNVLS
jgi:hypothetical protein